MKAARVSGAATEYVCPMCPGVVSDRPGPCPKCGMSLEPRAVTLDRAQDGDQRDLAIRLWVGAALSLPILVLSLPHMVGLGSYHHGSPWWLAGLSAPVVLGCGWPFLRRAWDSVLRRSPNMFTLIAVGTLSAFGYSAAALLAPRWFPPSARGPDGEIPVYFESAALITVLVLLGQWLEARARRKTGDALRSLLGLAPATVLRIQGGREEEIPLSQVAVGDRLRVRPGERLPVDGVVVEGRGVVDESLVTGEPVPVEKFPGEAVIGGTLNGTGSFEMKAERVGSKALLARIVSAVAEAQRSRAPSQRLADRISAWFVPAVIGVAVAASIGWWLWGPDPKLSHALVCAVTVLIIACPCALGLATPLAVTVAMGRAAGMGVLFRDAEALERSGSIDTLVVDKTGTLTEGHPTVTGILPLEGFSEEEVFRWALALAARSEHPLSGAIVRFGRSAPDPIDSFEAVPGQGVRGRWRDREISLGRDTFVSRTRPDRSAQFGDDVGGEIRVFVGVDGRVAGCLRLRDLVRPTSREALDGLRRDGIRILMLTGDRLPSARAVAEALGITDFAACLLPEDKIGFVKRLQKEGRRVAMAGDGINDAPALSQADVGIAIGSGAGIALEAAAVTLVKGDLRGVHRAIRLGRAAGRNIRQNLWLAFLYNGIGVPLAAALLVGPIFAGAAMSLSSLSVVGNALRLRYRRLD